MGRHTKNARVVIIDAAEDVVIRTGARHLTLDAVAAEAGVSKGGLLYHFPNKEALLSAMLDRRMTRLEEGAQQKYALLPDQANRALVARIRALLETDDKTRKLSVALLAAVAHDPQFLVPYRKEYKRLLDEFCRTGLNFERTAVVMLAADGLKLLELFSLVSFTPEERNGIIEEIIALSEKEEHD